MPLNQGISAERRSPRSPLNALSDNSADYCDFEGCGNRTAFLPLRGNRTIVRADFEVARQQDCCRGIVRCSKNPRSRILIRKRS